MFMNVCCFGLFRRAGVCDRPGLPAGLSEGLVRLSHLVSVLTTFDRGTKAVARIEQLVHQALGHGFLAALPGVHDDPPNSQRRAAAGLGLDGYLVRGTADAAALDLDRRTDVVECPLQRDNRVGLRLGAATF